MALLAELARHPDMGPGVFHATILHQTDECTPSRCVCEPEIVLEEATAENIAAGAERQREWLRRVCS